MRTSDDVLEFISEQQSYVLSLAKEKSIAIEHLKIIKLDLSASEINDRYWMLETLKYFIHGKI